MEKKKVVQAIDLGFGFTKLVEGINANGQYKLKSYPSITAISSGKKNLGGGFFAERDTVSVEQGGVMYEVGKDAVMAQSGFSTRILDNRYIYSDDYQALMKGALKMMRTDHIDLLVLGAPVKNYDEAKGHLKQAWEGLINLDGENKVRVVKVLVLPQPLGGFAWHGHSTGTYEKMRSQRNLILDPGHFTFDWLLAHDMKMTKRSNSFEGGMSFVISAIADSLGIGSSNLDTLNAIDEHFYKNKPFMLGGKVVDLAPHMPVAKAVIKRAVAAMAANIGDSSNIDNIVMLGGGAELYSEEVMKAFPNHQIKIAKGKSFANVMGYQWIGEQIANGKR